MNLEEELAIEVNPWRGRIITLGVLAGVLAVIGVVVYVFFFTEDKAAPRPTEEVQVGRATINSNLIVSGDAESQLISDLTFRSAGKVGSINVEVGDAVKQGDVLATLDDEELNNAVESAQANLDGAQARLAALLEGATDSELANASRQLVEAQAGLDTQQRNLDDLLAGPTDVQLRAEEQSVASAQAALNQALRDRQALIDGPSDAQIVSANQVVISAQAALDQAMRDRQTLQDGPTAVQIAQANQAVASAQSNLNAAQRALDDLLNSPTDAQVASAQQAVASAQANLASAEANLDRLNAGPDDAAVAAAEAQLASAQQGVDSAQTAVDNADNNVDTAEAGLLAAGSVYCGLNPGDGVCSPFNTPLSTGEVNSLLDLLGNPATDSSWISPINTLIQANAAYHTALNAADSAAQALDSAQAALDAAQANLDAVNEGPSDEDVNAAEAAVTAAEQSLSAAQLNLQELLDGPDASDIDNARDQVVAAQSALDAATASRDDLVNGPSADDLAAADDAVMSAQATLDTAVANQEDLLNGADQSDFDRADDQIRSAQAALDAAQARLDDLLNNPSSDDVDAARDNVTVGEAAVNAAQAVLDETKRGPRQTQIDQETANVASARLALERAQIQIRDAQIISPFDGTVAAVNLNLGEFTSASPSAPPIVLLTPDAIVLDMNIGETDYPQIKLDQTGVAIFDALPGKFYPFRIMEIGLAPSVTQGVVTYPVKAAVTIPPDGPRPAPGMSANGQIVTDSKVDVIAVPARAIRRSGGDQVVDVKRNGTVEEQVVVTGASDNTNVEIISGLEEGETIVIPKLVSGSDSGNEPQPTLPEGIR